MESDLEGGAGNALRSSFSTFSTLNSYYDKREVLSSLQAFSLDLKADLSKGCFTCSGKINFYQQADYLCLDRTTLNLFRRGACRCLLLHLETFRTDPKRCRNGLCTLVLTDLQPISGER